MRKLKKTIYFFLIILVSSMSIVIYRNISKGNEQNPQEKAFSEIQYIETNLVSLLNDLNNIDSRNYSISITEIRKQNNNENSESQNSSSNTTTSESVNSDSVEEKYDLIQNGILTASRDINWNDIKGKIEILYSSIPEITLDLYNLNINQNDILQFNKEFDNLTEIVRNEKKEESLTQLSKIYDFMPKFVKNITDDEVYKTTIESKSNIIRAYSKIDIQNWQDISNDVKQALDIYSKLLTNNDSKNSKQNISKIYVMLGELQSSSNNKNQSAFLIKYRNILEEMNNI